MKKVFFGVCAIFIVLNSLGQTVQFDKKTLRVNEPYEIGKDMKEVFDLQLIVNNLTPSNSIKADPIQILANSTFPIAKVNLLTSRINQLQPNNVIKVELQTDAYSDESGYILLSINYEDLNDPSHIKSQLVDTIFVKNTFPFKALAENALWNEGKRAEIFIGTNFDFLSDNVTTDWYGGLGIFLPAITNFKYNKGKVSNTPRFGFNGGLYHSRSFSNFGTVLPTDYDNIARTIVRRYIDTVNNVILPATDYQQDTINIKTKMELNNWGAYLGVMYQFSRYQSNSDDFVTNIFVGAHAEVIRRSVLTSYTFDTTGTIQRTVYGTNPSLSSGRALPKTNTAVYYDSYFGINMPIQFLWKEIIDLKIVPCFGMGSASYFTSRSKPVPCFYLVNFDLLAKLGGIKLNLGGEVRGYFPDQNPIFAAYLGTSFSISKLAEFVSK